VLIQVRNTTRSSLVLVYTFLSVQFCLNPYSACVSLFVPATSVSYSLRHDKYLVIYLNTRAQVCPVSSQCAVSSPGTVILRGCLPVLTAKRTITLECARILVNLPHYQISWASFEQFLNCYIRTDGQTHQWYSAFFDCQFRTRQRFTSLPWVDAGHPFCSQKCCGVSLMPRKEN
jgi:hypothetical protein